MESIFKQLILHNIREGMTFENPGRGTSKIIRVTSEHITYRRGNSNITVKIDDLDKAYTHFASSKCSQENHSY